MRRPFLRVIAAAIIGLLLAVPLAPALPISTRDLGDVDATTRSYVVGYSGAAPVGLLASLGARATAIDPTLAFVVVETSRPDLLEALAASLPAIRYVELNGASVAAASSWDASSWDGARWDAASWDGATWDASSWDGATWDASSWDGATWDASSWDASSWDASSWDGATWDASSWDGATWDGATWDGEPNADPGFGAAWHLGAIHAPAAWTTTVAHHARTICVLDSGVDAGHPDLAPNMKRLPSGATGYDFVNNDNDPADDGGHGTFMAGIAAGVLGNGRGISGVSQAYVLSAKVLGATGVGTEANLAMGLRWCADNGANIGLMSLHIDKDNSAVREAVAYAKAKGLLMVAAAGNGGKTCDACIPFPAAYPDVLGVGATAPNGSVAGFSNGGKTLALVAPGVSIPGTLPGDRYGVGSGTSHAAAVAAGAAALVWTAKPTQKASDVASVLTKSAKDGGTSGFDMSFGNGHLRLDRAFESLKAK